ncbi:MAG: hypothetical protein ACYTG6_12830 [Planctomycetota bacterium]|jgi:hypothetical protein
MEVVELEFDPARVSIEDLVERADAGDCAARVFTRTDAQQDVAVRLIGERAVRSDEEIRIDDDKYYLSRTEFRFVPMTPLQASRANASIGKPEEAAALLSPSQRKLLASIRANPEHPWDDAIGVAFEEAWATASSRLASLDDGASPR